MLTVGIGSQKNSLKETLLVTTGMNPTYLVTYSSRGATIRMSSTSNELRARATVPTDTGRRGLTSTTVTCWRCEVFMEVHDHKRNTDSMEIGVETSEVVCPASQLSNIKCVHHQRVIQCRELG